MSENINMMPKGYRMEEVLRNYFLRSGYFVVRGVPFTYEGFDVTDIDLWLYSRTSSVSREVTIVDAKNKKTPQAIERIFWVQGLRIATESTNAIVATMDKRQEVRDFGRKLGVVVLDGNFLQRLSVTEDLTERISDEDFFTQISQYRLGKLDGDWKGRIRYCKSLLSKQLSFDVCNEWILHAKFFAEQSVTKGISKELALRCLYSICAYIAIGVDYSMKEISFHEIVERSKMLKEGFTYGSKGSVGINQILKVATGLIEENITNGSRISQQLRRSVENDLAKLKSGILADFFSKNDVFKNLFALAKEFESLAMKRDFSHHSNASTELRSMLYSLLDYWDIPRELFK